MSLRSRVLRRHVRRPDAPGREGGSHRHARRRWSPRPPAPCSRSAAGTGANLGHYRAGRDLADRHRARRLHAQAPRAPSHAPRRLRPWSCGPRPRTFPSRTSTFDTVVSTLVLCGVDDQPRAVREIRRVLRPGGRFLFLEHVRSADPARSEEAGPDELAQPGGRVLRLQPADARNHRARRLPRHRPGAHRATQGSQLRSPGHRRRARHPPSVDRAQSQHPDQSVSRPLT